MPIYEYRCPDCGHQFESLQKMSDDPLTDCPSCGEHQVKKLVSRSAFLLKGGGWYKDHYGLKSSGGESSSTTGGKSTDSAGKSTDSAGKSADGGSKSADSGSKSAAASKPTTTSSAS